MKPGDTIGKYKNCLICNKSIDYDHHFGRCWKCICKERLKHYEDSLKIYENNHNLQMIEIIKKEIEKWNKEMITETKIQKEGIERHKFCDICGEEIYIGLACSSARCSYCNKDLCEKDIGNEEETGGDYRHVWCKECWSKGDKYRPIIEKLHREIEDLYEKWQSECK